MKCIGIEREGKQFRIASLSIVRRKIQINYLQSSYKREKGARIVVGMDSQDLVMRHFTTPLKKRSALYKTLPFQLETLIPYPLDEVIVKPFFHFKKGKTEVLLFALPKKRLKEQLHLLEEEGIDPDYLSAAPIALYRFARFACPSLPSLLVFHAGSDKMQLLSIREGRIANHLTLHLPPVDQEEKKWEEALKKEVDRALCFLDRKEEDKGERKVLVCGMKWQEVSRSLREYKAHSISLIETTAPLGVDLEEARSFALPIGLAIDSLKNDAMSIQFRQEDQLSHRQRRSIQRQQLVGVGMALSLAVLLFVFSSLYFNAKEGQLRHQFQELLSTYEEDIPPLKTLNREAKSPLLIESIRQLLFKEKKRENLFAPPPLVSDLLTFLSSHPQLEEMAIEEVDYQLKQRPTFAQLTQKYQVQVALTFKVEELEKALAFREALAHDNQFIDTSAPIGWHRDEDRYQATFFLRS